jgi:hypothetical protein
MNANLIVEVGPDRFAEVARGWLTATMHEVIPGLAGDLRARPVVRAKTLGNADSTVPWGEPGHVLAWVGRHRRGPVDGREVLYTQRTWERTLAALDNYPFGASLRITRLDEQGFPLHWDAEQTVLRVWRDNFSPGQVRLSFGVSAGETGWPDAPELQDEWARFVKRQAATVGACWGSMTDDIGGLFTALDRATAASRGSPNLASPRQVLPGYSWVTVVAAEHAARLGGAGALTASGAFCEVEELPNGGLWLRATPTINEFTGQGVQRVFHALAPVLLTGTTRFDFGERYRLVEGVDAADFRQRGSPC